MSKPNITEDDFYKWCVLKEKNLESYKRISLFSNFSQYIFPILWALPYLVSFIVHSLKTTLEKYPYFYFIWMGVALVITIFSIRFVTLPMGQIEFIACLLYKISNQIELSSSPIEKRELIKDLKILKKNLEIDVKFPNRNLFRKDIKKQDSFYSLLRELPLRLLCELNKPSNEKIDHTNIRKLAYYLYTDSDEKMLILENISREYPSIKLPESQFISGFSREFSNNNWFKLSAIAIPLLLLAYIINFYLSISPDTLVLAYTTLLGVSAYIIWNK